MTRAEILAQAALLVGEDRNKQYGDPRKSLDRIAALWRAYCNTDGITSADVAAMLALVKIARISHNNAHADSWIDLAGYAACGGEIATQQNDRNTA